MGLTTPQLRYLEALADGVERFSTGEVLTRYELGSSAMVGRIRTALEKKDILDHQGPKTVWLTPCSGIGWNAASGESRAVDHLPHLLEQVTPSSITRWMNTYSSAPSPSIAGPMLREHSTSMVHGLPWPTAFR